MDKMANGPEPSDPEYHDHVSPTDDSTARASTGAQMTTSQGDAPRARRVLILTNSEHGQANVCLAVSDTLLNDHEDVELHFGSFAPMERFVRATEEHARRTHGHGRAIRFHRVDGLQMKDAWLRPEIYGDDYARPRRDGWWAQARRTRVLLRAVMPWLGPEFLDIFRSSAAIIAAVAPDVVAVDPCFAPGLTACRHAGVSLVILTPNTIKDYAMAAQPNGEPLWKYPAVGTGIPYPVPWYYIPLNVFIVVVSLAVGRRDAARRQAEQHLRRQAGLAGARLLTLGDISMDMGLGVPTVVANLPELEYPLSAVPPHVVACGPIVRPAPPVAAADPGLARWLGRGPTAYVNLGTHMLYTEDMAVEMARALRAVLDEARGGGGGGPGPGLQVLWKLVRYKGGGGDLRYAFSRQAGDYEVGAPGSRVHGVLGRYLDAGVVRVAGWLEAEPISILEHENVVLSVHHGGANSFLEAASAGVPQVVLPCWIDTYDFAYRAEIAGVGLQGNKKSIPYWRAEELGPVLREILLGGRAGEIREKAEAIARLCRENGGGRVKAARTILEAIKGPARGEPGEAGTLKDGGSAETREV